MHRPRISIVAGPVLWIAAAAAAADVQVRILTRDGSWTDGALRTADAEAWTLSARDGRGGERRIATSEIVAFTAGRAGEEPNPPSPISAGLIELNTGERLPGNLRNMGSAGNFWDHRWIGAVPIALEDLAVLRVRGATAPDRRADGDTLQLLNGDILVGFVDSVGESVVFEETGDAREKRSISMDRMAAIAFASIDRPTIEHARIWTLDGSVVDGKDLRFDESDGWGFTLANPRLAAVRAKRTSDNAAANPVAAVFAIADVVPIAALGRPAVSVPSGQFHYGYEDAVRIAPPDRAMLGLSTIEIDGPLELRFAQPASKAGGGRSVMTLEIALREPFPSDARVGVEVRIGSATSGRVQLDASTPVVPIRLEAAPAAGGLLEIRIDDGGNGPVGDVVEVRRACIVTPRQ